jgi:hypothetical protein
VPKASKIDRPHRVRTAPPLRRCSAPTLTPMLRAYVCQSTVSLSSRGRSFGISQSLPCACAAKTATAFGLRRRSASARRPVWEVGGRHGQLLDAGHAHRPPARHWWLRRADRSVVDQAGSRERQREPTTDGGKSRSVTHESNCACRPPMIRPAQAKAGTMMR